MADPKLANLLRTDNAWKGDADLAAFNQIEAQAEPWYRKGLPMEGRAILAPIRNTMEGSVFNKKEWALPAPVAWAVNTLTAGNRAYTGSDPTFNPQEEAASFAGGIMGGGIATSKALSNPTGRGGKDVGMFIGKSSPLWDENAPKMLGPDGVLRQEISDKNTFLKGTDNYERSVMDFLGKNEDLVNQQGGEVLMKNVFDAPDLYKAYPELQNYNMRLLPSDGALLGRKGSDNTMWVRGNLTPEEARSTILHEMQHHIQENEGFARGGSARAFAKEPTQEHNRYMGAINGLNKQMKEAAGTPQYAALMDERDALVIEARQRGVLYPTQIAAIANDKYKRLAGEAEARLTQARRNMTKEELAATNPYDPAYFLKSTETPIDNLVFQGTRKQLLEQEFDNLKK
jgi:hypothetical protein